MAYFISSKSLCTLILQLFILTYLYYKQRYELFLLCIGITILVRTYLLYENIKIQRKFNKELNRLKKISLTIRKLNEQIKNTIFLKEGDSFVFEILIPTRKLLDEIEEFNNENKNDFERF